MDGREFIDFVCSWGPNLLGHHRVPDGSGTSVPDLWESRFVTLAFDVVAAPRH